MRSVSVTKSLMFVPMVCATIYGAVSKCLEGRKLNGNGSQVQPPCYWSTFTVSNEHTDNISSEDDITGTDTRAAQIDLQKRGMRVSSSTGRGFLSMAISMYRMSLVKSQSNEQGENC